MDDRSPLSLSLTMAHRLWPEVDVALAVGLALPARPDRLGPGRRAQGDPDRPRPGRDHPPCPARGGVAGRTPARRSRRCCRRSASDDRAAWRERAAATKEEFAALYRRELAPQVAFLDAIRAALPEDGILVEDLTQIGYVARIALPVHGPRQYITSGYQGTLGHAFASGARRQGRAARARRGRDRRRRRLHVQRPGARDRRRSTASTSWRWCSTTARTATSGACSASSTATA